MIPSMYEQLDLLQNPRPRKTLHPEKRAVAQSPRIEVRLEQSDWEIGETLPSNEAAEVLNYGSIDAVLKTLRKLEERGYLEQVGKQPQPPKRDVMLWTRLK